MVLTNLLVSTLLGFFINSQPVRYENDNYVNTQLFTNCVQFVDEPSNILSFDEDGYDFVISTLVDGQYVDLFKFDTVFTTVDTNYKLFEMQFIPLTVVNLDVNVVVNCPNTRDAIKTQQFTANCYEYNNDIEPYDNWNCNFYYDLNVRPTVNIILNFTLANSTLFNFYTENDGTIQHAYDDGYNTGRIDGYSDGFAIGKTVGFNEGFNTALQGHSFSFTNLFASISDTPILMIRRMFNFDIFGVSAVSILLTLFSALIFIKIIKRVV